MIPVYEQTFDYFLHHKILLKASLLLKAKIFGVVIAVNA